MSTAIAPETKTVTFISKCPGQVLVRRGVRYVQDGENGRRALDEAEWISRQEDLNFQRVSKGEPELEVDLTPWKVTFVNHRYEVPDDLPEQAREKLLNFLRGHRRFNQDGPSGFWEEGKAPDEPRPTLTEQTREIGAASAAGDHERLEAVLTLEKETHNREAVIVAAEAAITGLQELAGLAAGADQGDPGEPSSASDSA